MRRIRTLPSMDRVYCTNTKHWRFPLAICTLTQVNRRLPSVSIMTVTVSFTLLCQRILAGILITSYLPHTLAASKQCFDRNGNQLSTERALPCNPNSAQDGPCCAPGDICLSNGLCQPGPDLVKIGLTDTYKPTCTDGTWTIDTCFSGCNSCK